MSSPLPATATAPPATRLAARGGTPFANRALFLGLVLATLALFPPLAAHRPWQDSFTTYFIAIVLESVPYILIGSLVGGLIEVFLPATVLPRLVARLGHLSIPVTALAAPAFPACECGVLAVARGLMRKGLPLPHTVTYLLAGPILNPTVLFTTWLAFRDQGALYPVLRAVGALVVAVTFGFALRRVDPRRILLPHIADGVEAAGRAGAAAADACCGHEHGDHDHDHAPATPRAATVALDLGQALRGAPRVALAARPAAPRRSRLASTLGRLSAQVLDHFLEMAAFFLMGVFVAAAMRTWLGNGGFAELGTGAVSGPLVMMAAAFVLSLCAEADAFVARSFTEFTVPAHLAFLVFGPMFDIKLFLMYRAVFRGWFIGALALGIAALVGLYVAVLTLIGVGAPP